MKKRKQKLIVAKFSAKNFSYDQLAFFEQNQASRSSDVKQVSLEGLLEDGWEIKSVGDWHSAKMVTPGADGVQSVSFVQTIVLEKEGP